MLVFDDRDELARILGDIGRTAFLGRLLTVYLHAITNRMYLRCRHCLRLNILADEMVGVA